MTVSEFIKKLKEFGYDENTELVFGMYTNTEFGDWKELQVRGCQRVCVLRNDGAGVTKK